jgi:ankyrin repeat protein
MPFERRSILQAQLTLAHI